MYKFKTISEFITEETSIEKAREKIYNARRKSEKFTDKATAAEAEEEFRKEQLDYEQRKEQLRRRRDSADSKVDKAKSKEELAKLKEDWKVKKKEMTDRIKNMRKNA